MLPTQPVRGDDAGMSRTGNRSKDRLLWALVAATALCYVIGYPLALIGKSSVGWVLVTLGGPLLAAVVWQVIRRVQN